MGAASGTVNRLAGQWAETPPAEKPPAEKRPRSSCRVRVIRDCPKCQQPLWVVTGARWCSRCGYRQMCNDTPAPVAAPKPELLGRSAVRQKLAEWAQAAQLLPRWAWVMLGGLLAVGLGSLDANLLLPPDSWARAVWTTAQVVTGVVGMLLAHVSVVCFLGLQHDAPGLWDLVMPDRVWKRAIKRLPLTKGQVCAAAWSLALVVCGLVFVGGLTYWLPKKGETKPQVYVAKLLDIKKEQLEAEEAPRPEAAEPPRPQPLPSATQPGAGEPPAKPETARCVVVGYTVENDEVTGLVVARVEGDELRYAGTVRPNLTPEQRDDLLKRFAKLAAKRPVFQNFEKPVVWLKPELTCEVEHAGAADGPVLKEPRFKGLVEDEKPGDSPEKTPTTPAPEGPKPERTPPGAPPSQP
jgi:hypothetical protein